MKIVDRKKSNGELEKIEDKRIRMMRNMRKMPQKKLSIEEIEVKNKCSNLRTGISMLMSIGFTFLSFGPIKHWCEITF